MADLLERLDDAANEHLIDWAADWQHDTPSNRPPILKFIEAEAAKAIRERNSLLQEAASTISMMLTLYGMDENPDDMSGTVHNKARAMVAAIREKLHG